MAILMIFRFCGIGYFANTYKEHTLIPWVQELVLFALKWVEMIFILLILTRVKLYIALIISFLYIQAYWFINSTAISFLLDVVYMIFVPFIVSKFQYKRITYGIILVIVLSIYQFIMMIARYNINLAEKFNYIAGIASVFDYKIFVMSIYLLIKCWRLKMARINTPNPEDEKNFGGGHCMLFWGKFEKFCEAVGKIIVGVCTLGIAPLSVYLYRKHKDKPQDAQKTE